MGKYSGFMLCSDIDGTLTYNGKISDANLDAIRRFEDGGGMFVLSTGRQPGFAGRELGFHPNSPLICVNGTMIFDTNRNECLWKHPLDDRGKEIALTMAKLFSDRIHCFVLGFEGYEKEVRTVEEAQELIRGGKDVLKVVYVNKSPDIALEFMKYVNENFSDHVKVDRSWDIGTEIHILDSGKNVCIAQMKRLFPEIHTAIAVGDYENDLEMIRDADIGYAVENAVPAVKAVADRIAPSNDRDAIKYIVENI